MEYVFMLIAVVFAVASNMILHKFKNRSFATPGDIFMFNAGISAVWFVVLIIWSAVFKDFSITLTSMLFGVVYGLILCLFLYFKTQAMVSGPIALTSLVGNCAFIIATWFGVVYASETIVPLQIVGMLVLVAALVLCINPKKSSEKLRLQWFVWCGLFFLAGGLLGIFNKVFGRSDVANQINSMMLTAALVSAILFIAFGYSVNISTHNKRPKIHKDSLIYMISCGIVGCLYLRLNIWLAGIIPSIVFFPVANGANVLLSTVLGQIIFKEKLNKIQLAGILIGLGAIMLIGCPQLFI